MPDPAKRFRQANAEYYQKKRAERTNEEQIAVLDERLGTGQGAVKERARLNSE
ncbi:hypothetical protein SEA_GODONK_133 [Gordonia phage GodonK]|uniref:Uncharacterized protein n=1 Tax=Gordonia phage GodonK TaxID=2562192 RepID=A0A4D6E258_9CAUD|nr:hypothetical protein HOV33_gp213 [Gordonia phage GodonK]QBZ72743.1 hypothetical protein SEA_GODONK_133 [Gordonia phage GodonK]